MNNLPACERLAHELRELRMKAGSPSYAMIKALGEQQEHKVALRKSKLSSWFSGTNVPADGRPFTTLIALLEAKALQKSGTPKQGVDAWQVMRKAAEQEKRRADSSGDDRSTPDEAETPQRSEGIRDQRKEAWTTLLSAVDECLPAYETLRWEGEQEAADQARHSLKRANTMARQAGPSAIMPAIDAMLTPLERLYHRAVDQGERVRAQQALREARAGGNVEVALAFAALLGLNSAVRAKGRNDVLDERQKAEQALQALVSSGVLEQCHVPGLLGEAMDESRFGFGSDSKSLVHAQDYRQARERLETQMRQCLKTDTP